MNISFSLSLFILQSLLRLAGPLSTPENCSQTFGRTGVPRTNHRHGGDHVERRNHRRMVDEELSGRKNRKIANLFHLCSRYRYRVDQGLRLNLIKEARWLFLGHFRPLLKQVIFWGAVAKMVCLKLNCQVNLVMFSLSKSTIHTIVVLLRVIYILTQSRMWM